MLKITQLESRLNGPSVSGMAFSHLAPLNVWWGRRLFLDWHFEIVKCKTIWDSALEFKSSDAFSNTKKYRMFLLRGFVAKKLQFQLFPFTKQTRDDD